MATEQYGNNCKINALTRVESLAFSEFEKFQIVTPASRRGSTTLRKSSINYENQATKRIVKDTKSFIISE